MTRKNLHHEIFYLTYFFTFAYSNYSHFDPNTNGNKNSTSEKTCHCYDEQENDYEYIICRDSIEGIPTYSHTQEQK